MPSFHGIGFKSSISIGFAAIVAVVVMVPLSSTATAGLAGLKRVAVVAQPLFATYAPGDRGRLFIVQKYGSISILDLSTNVLDPTPFLSLPETDPQVEGGLLGMAFHPDYATNGKFYVYVTVDNGGILVDGVASPYSSHVREYTVSENPNIANTDFNTVWHSVRPDYAHNAGWIGFSPNNPYLHIMSGDGGHAFDTGPGHNPSTGNAQDITDNLFGKVLRVDIDNGDAFPEDPDRNYAIPPSNPFVGKEGDDEIWAYGLRNPYRASFDRATGDLWIADVGQNQREEIDFQSADSPGGENYGWRLREGSVPTGGGVGGDRPEDNVDPVYDYDRDADEFGGRTGYGGYVYRGPDPELQGQFIFGDAGFGGDLASRKFWQLNPADIPMEPGDPPLTVADIKPLLPLDVGIGRYPVSLGEDAVGNLYVCFLQSGEVYRIDTDSVTPGDFNADAHVAADDLSLWTSSFGDATGSAPGDANGDGRVDGADFLEWQRNLGYSALEIEGESPAVAAPEPTSLSLGSLIAAVQIISSGAGRPRRNLNGACHR